MPWAWTPIPVDPDDDEWGAELNDGLDVVYDAVTDVEAGTALVRVPWASGDRRTAIQTALTAAASAGGGTVRLGPGNHQVSGYLDIPADVRLVGDSDRGTTLTQTGSNTPIVRMGIASGLTDMNLTYSSQQSAAQTGSIAVELHLAFIARLERLRIVNAHTGIGLAKTRGSTFLASCTIADIEILFYSGWAVHLEAIDNTSTGSVFTNVYTHNNPSEGVRNLAAGGILLANMSDTALSVINIEHSRHTEPSLTLSSCEGITIAGLHFEGIEHVSNFSGLIGLFGETSTVMVNVAVLFSFLTSANTPNLIGLVKIDNGARLAIHGLKERSNTVTTPAFPILYGGGELTSSHVWMWDVDVESTTGRLAGSTADPYRWYNDRMIDLRLGPDTGTPGRLWVDAGALKYTSPGGTTTTVAPA